jgi:hypothetical protein
MNMQYITGYQPLYHTLLSQPYFLPIDLYCDVEEIHVLLHVSVPTAQAVAMQLQDLSSEVLQNLSTALEYAHAAEIDDIYSI